MSSRARNKLTVRQVASITKLGVHSDGGGLYLRVRQSGRSWFYIGTLHGNRIELGLGSVLDVTLAKAREKAGALREMILDGIDPREERAKAKAKPKPKVTFGAFAKELVADIEDGFKNPKHRQQWRNTLDTYAKPMMVNAIEYSKSFTRSAMWLVARVRSSVISAATIMPRTGFPSLKLASIHPM